VSTRLISLHAGTLERQSALIDSVRVDVDARKVAMDRINRSGEDMMVASIDMSKRKDIEERLKDLNSCFLKVYNSCDCYNH